MLLRLALLLLLALGACDGGDNPLTLATVDSPYALGMSLRELPQETLKSIGLAYGLAVIRLGAPAERSGLRIGDVVYGVNQKKLRSLEEFSKLIAQASDGRVGLLVRRGRTDLYVPVELGGPPRPPQEWPKGGRPSTDTLLRT